jgi:peptide/nickel transport system substrate-binding protein
LVVSQASGPKTFNPLFATDTDTLGILNCVMSVLVRINRQTGEAEPELAESLTSSSDHRVLTIRLRPGVTFSDGHPLTADDVLFTFQVIYDPALRSSVRDVLDIEGGQIVVEKKDSRTVTLTFPKPVATSERLLDSVHILPKHRLEADYRAGRFASRWDLSTPPEEIVGLGPFRLKEYVPGERTVLVRNPHYWKRDPAGRPLPYLDEITFLILPDRSTRVLKFQQGELDLLSPLTPEEVARLEPQVAARRIRIYDLGPSLISEVMWFNLNPRARSLSPTKLAWFQDVRFRQAVSFAINRQALIDVVFAGKAAPVWGPVPTTSPWFHQGVKTYPYDPLRAKALLAEAGFSDRNGDGVLEDAQGNALAFTLVTNAGNPLRERMGLMIQEDLKKVGIRVNFAPIETKTMLDRLARGTDYEAGLLAIAAGDTDPSSLRNFLLSSGSNHWWNPQQPTPATEWEKRIDELLNEFLTTGDQRRRKALFDEVQTILSEQVPLIYLVARDLIVGAKPTVGNLKPGLLPDPLLWNAEELYVE